MSYQWFHNGTGIPLASGTSYTINSAQTNDTGDYWVEVRNLAGLTTSRTAKLIVLSSNDIPIGTDDTYGTTEDVLLNVAAPGVLTNDSDLYPGTLIALLVSNASQGNVSLNTNGSFTYRPNTNFNGTDSFTYRAREGGVSILEQNASGGNKIEIKAGQKGAQSFQHGIAGNPDFTIDEVVLYLSRESIAPNANLNFNIGTAINSGAIAGSTISINPSSISNTTSGSSFQTYRIVYATPVGPLTAGTTYYLNLECQPANGKRIWSEYAGISTYANGTYFKAGVNDGKDIKFQIAAGQLSGLTTVTIAVDPVNDIPIANNDTADGLEDTSVTINVLANDSDPEGPLFLTNASTTNGSLIIIGDNILFTPATNYYGSAILSYTVSDGTDSATASVTVNIMAVNDPPLANDDSASVAEDTSVSINVLANDLDVEGTRLTITDAFTTNGTAVISGTNIVFRPATNFNGLVIFSYTVSDGTNSGTADVTVDVTPVNDAPFAVNDVTNTLEDTSVTIHVLDNDSDVEGASLFVTDAVTTNGTAVIVGRDIIFTPATNFNGSVIFTYAISDGTNSATGNVAVTVFPVNDAPPMAINDTYATLEDMRLTIAVPGVLQNDSDVDGDALTAVLVTNVMNGTLNFNANGSFIYTPGTNFNGSDSFAYHASDGLAAGNVAIVAIEVIAVNDAPIASNDVTNALEDTSVIINVLANDTDAEGAPLTIVGTLTTNGSAVISGSNIVFTPSTNFNGTVVFNYTVSDGTNSATANVTVVVIPVNDVPIANNDSTNTLEDVSVTIKVLANDSDVEGPLIIANASTTNGTAIVNGTNVVFTPSTNFNGTVVLSYTISDGTNTATANVTVVVTPVNDAPIANNDSTNTLEDVSVTINVLANDFDVEGARLTITGTSTTNGTAVVSGTNVVFTPATNFNGTVVFNYTVSDGTNTATANVTVVVTPVNDVPIANNDSTNTLEDVSVTIKVLANDSDVEGPLIIASASTTNGTAIVSGTNVVFTPSTNFNGTVVFSYTISDGTNTATANVTVAVTPVNDVPIANNDSANTLEDVSVTINVLANDFDVEGTRLIITGTSTTNGTIVLSGTNLVFTPASNFYGTVVFNYTVSDGTNAATANVTVTVDPVYDPPIAFNDSASTPEDVSVTINVLANDSNPELLTLAITPFATNGTSVVMGTNIVFTPPTNFFGTIVFRYTIADGITVSTGIVNVTVTPVNDAPLANSDTYTTREDVSLSVPAPGVLSNDTDVENNALTALLVTNVSHGSLTLNANGSFIYTPASNYFGKDVFAYRVFDGVASSAASTVVLNTLLDTPLRIVSYRMITNGFKLQLAGPSPAVYEILASTNQTGWTPVSSQVALTGTAEFIDTNGMSNPHRFYQAMVGEQSTIVLQQNTNSGNKIFISSGKAGAQSFLHGNPGEPSYTLSKVVLYLSRDATAPNVNLNFNVGTDINSGALTGSSVAIDPLSITNATAGASFQRYEIIFTTAVGPLTAGTTYYLNLANEESNGGRVYLERGTGATYPNGTFYRGGTDQALDVRFEILGQ